MVANENEFPDVADDVVGKVEEIDAEIRRLDGAREDLNEETNLVLAEYQVQENELYRERGRLVDHLKALAPNIAKLLGG